MGLFEKIFQNSKKPSLQQAEGGFQTITAYQPIFTSWNGFLYENALVRASIDTRARHNSKLKAELVGDENMLFDKRLIKKPNSWQTWSQFLYRTSTILDMQNTCFLVPVFNEWGKTEGVFSVLPSRCTINQYAGEPWLVYQFNNGKTAAMEFSNCGILTKFQYKDDFFGESNKALNSTMELIDIQNQGIEEAVKSAATYRFYASLANFSNDNDLTKERKNFNSENFKSDGSGGVLLFPITYKDIHQIESKPFTVDDKQMAQIKENVFDYFGVNDAVLQNKAIGDEWAAFYDGAIEPFAVQMSEVMTNLLYTEAEQDNGNEFMLTANRLQYASTKEKTAITIMAADRGLMMIDEIRADIWGKKPLPNGLGQRIPIRGEYKNLNELLGESNYE